MIFCLNCFIYIFTAYIIYLSTYYKKYFIMYIFYKHNLYLDIYNRHRLIGELNSLETVYIISWNILLSPWKPKVILCPLIILIHFKGYGTPLSGDVVPVCLRKEICLVVTPHYRNSSSVIWNNIRWSIWWPDNL